MSKEKLGPHEAALELPTGLQVGSEIHYGWSTKALSGSVISGQGRVQEITPEESIRVNDTTFFLAAPCATPTEPRYLLSLELVPPAVDVLTHEPRIDTRQAVAQQITPEATPAPAAVTVADTATRRPTEPVEEPGDRLLRIARLRTQVEQAGAAFDRAGLQRPFFPEDGQETIYIPVDPWRCSTGYHGSQLYIENIPPYGYVTCFGDNDAWLQSNFSARYDESTGGVIITSEDAHSKNGTREDICRITPRAPRTAASDTQEHLNALQDDIMECNSRTVPYAIRINDPQHLTVEHIVRYLGATAIDNGAGGVDLKLDGTDTFSGFVCVVGSLEAMAETHGVPDLGPVREEKYDTAAQRDFIMWRTTAGKQGCIGLSRRETHAGIVILDTSGARVCTLEKVIQQSPYASGHTRIG